MPLPYHATARLNATPRLEHVEKEKQTEKPQFDSMDDLINAMKTDALQIRRRTKSIEMRDVSPDIVSDDQIISFLRQNPGSIVTQIAKAMNRKPKSLGARMCSMESRGQVRVEVAHINDGRNKVRKFFAVAKQPKLTKKGRPRAEKRAPTRDKTAAFIRENPGCTTRDVAEHLGISRKSASNRINDARFHANITSHSKGGSMPSQHWIEE
jgi:DNA-binding MarR family transcriptional regulator